jgi:hypothetical protein
MDAGTLHLEIAKVCPCASVRVVDPDKRETWSFTPGEGATPEQVTAGNNVIATIPVDFKPLPDPAPEDEVLFDHENRLRELEGQPPLSLGEFVAKGKKS